MITTPPGSIGRYVVRRELGRGMMGVVYLVHDPDLGRNVALKVIQLPPGTTEAERVGFESRFFAEAKSAARLTHPGIVTVHDVGRDPVTGSLFMALELLSGQTLETLLKQKRRLEWPEALRIVKRVAEALHHAHAEGVVHRDIKPANIMIQPSGEPKIMDFGIAKIETERLTADGQFFGTPLYMSPEQAMARPLDGRSDLFSLGSVLYEMITGVPAFAGENITKVLLHVIGREPDPPSSLVKSLSSSIDAVLERCLAKEAGRRYKDGQALAEDLTHVLEGRMPPGLTATTPSPSEPPTKAARSTIQPDPSPIDWAGAATRSLPAREPLAYWQILGLVALIAFLIAMAFVFQRPEAIPPASAAPTPTPTPTPTVPPTPRPRAHLVIDFEHSLKNGRLRLFIDNVMIAERSLDPPVTGKVPGSEKRKGQLTETFDVAAGRHEVQVQVAWDKSLKTVASQQTFTSNTTVLLRVRLGGLAGLRKDLSLEWN